MLLQQVGRHLFLGAILVLPCVALAEKAPSAPEASPDVYRIITENDHYRVIEATWQPGQKDELHSHGAVSAMYYLTECMLKIHTPDGKTVDAKPKVGSARIAPAAVDAHYAENVGSSECKVIFFEQK